MSSRKLTDLHPLMQPMVTRLLADARAAGIDLLVTCTYRSNAEQAALYAIGRTKPGRIVTNAKPGRSNHNTTQNGKPAALAVDVVPLRDGKSVWAASDPVWKKVGEIGEKVGLEWAGRWKTFREYPHFQHPDARNVRLSCD
jgi:peptidoglycan L-alanyl-D-glutamate endopeptidase CwlK